MAIREPIELGWKGETKKLVITMLIIERINNEIGILNASKIDVENLDFVKISKLYYILLDEIGIEVEWLEVYDTIYAISNKEKKAFFGNYIEICQMLMPNFNSPTAKKKPKPRKKSKR